MMSKIEKLVNDNEKLAYKVAHKFTPKVMVDFDDIKQMALIGLYKAAKSFDESKGVKFSTYAYRVATNEVLQEMRKFKNTSESIDEMEMDVTYQEPHYEDSTTMESVKVYLDDSEFKIVCMTMDGFNQKEISKAVGLSQSQVSRVFIRAKEKIRSVIDSGSLVG